MSPIQKNSTGLSNTVILDAGEKAAFSYHAWRNKVMFVRLKFAIGVLSPALLIDHINYNTCYPISATCPCCEKPVKAEIFFC